MYENNEKPKLRRGDIILPELSYSINGALFAVFKELGPGYQEKYYQRALVAEFRERNLAFNEQVKIPLTYKREDIGRYFLDFLVEEQVVLEIKRGDYFQKSTLNQVVAYLQATGCSLGLIANFTQNGVKVKRILNQR